jgi:uncharacterized RDD family membrane protein YckC
LQQDYNETLYAGFFTRLLSTVVDIFILTILLSITALVINEKSPVTLVVVWWLYNSIMITKYKATLGAKLFGIEVLNKDGEALSFKLASFRFFLSIAPFALYLFFRGVQHEMTVIPSPTLHQLPQLIFFIPPLLMLFTQKKQMIHDLVTHSVVVDQNEQNVEKGSIYTLRKILKIVASIILIVLFGYISIYVGVFYMLAKSSSDSYDASFEKHYSTNDYNNSKIMFYNNELEMYSKKFIEAEGMYDIFEADVKKDLALDCIEYFLKQDHNESDWINMGSSFRINARNKFTTTDKLIKKAKINENHMGKYFYYYDLNEVNRIKREVANSWEKDANTQTCQKKLPADQMYSMFINKYIKKTEESLDQDKYNHKHAKNYGVPDKSFYEKEIQKKTEWLNILYQKHPEYSEYYKRQQEIAKNKQLRRAQKELQEKRQKVLKMQQNIFKDIKDGKFFTQAEIKLLDFSIKNSKGQTPLMIAVKNGHDHIVSSLSKVDANFWAKDNYGKTAYEYIQKPKTKREKIFTDRMYGSLRMLEANQIVLNKAKIVHSSYKNKNDSLKITIVEAECKEFDFPKNTQCKNIN